MDLSVVEAIACRRCGLVHRRPYGAWRNPHEIGCACGAEIVLVDAIEGGFERLDHRERV
jgi:hypothetical protein